MSLKLLYRNPRQPGETGMKLVPDQAHGGAEEKILKELGFVVVEITAGFSFNRHAQSSVPKETGSLG